jgi:histidinol-phosphate aminotransferase
MGGVVKRVGVTSDLEIDIAGLLAAAASEPRMVIFANPMNPVGTWLAPADMLSLLTAHAANTLLVLDEAYAEYAAGADYPDTVKMLRDHPNGNWVVLRTFSKAYGLAGLRIGYGIVGDPTLCDYFNRARTPFNTNAIAQAAALLALDDEVHLQKSVSLALRERARVDGRLREMGFNVAIQREFSILRRRSECGRSEREPAARGRHRETLEARRVSELYACQHRRCARERSVPRRHWKACPKGGVAS